VQYRIDETGVTMINDIDPPKRKRGGGSIAQACWAASRGWAVLEIQRGSKIPARKWKDLVYRDPAGLMEAEGPNSWDNSCDVGIMTGPSGLVDIESDGPHGRDLLSYWCSDFPTPILEMETDSGSIHWVFSADGERYKTHSRWHADSCTPSCGLDVRGWGGYFLLFADDRRITWNE
jgi:hypothetical protein